MHHDDGDMRIGAFRDLILDVHLVDRNVSSIDPRAQESTG